MKLAGMQKLTLLDFPSVVACVAFTKGCNFRCPFCHNASLVCGNNTDSLTEEDVLSFLKQRAGILEGIVVTGGEPLLHNDIPDFFRRIKELGYLIKLDTNGTNPRMLEELIDESLVDYVAMDIKNCKERYAETAGIDDLDLAKICESVDLLLSGAVEYELRTTVVRQLHTADDMIAIAKWIKGARAYYLQTFKDSGDLIKPGFDGYSEAEMKVILRGIFTYIPNAQIRG